MNSLYALSDTSSIYSPALLFYKDLIRRNLAVALEIAGGPQRLRPHVKTHKTREIVYLELQAGITKLMLGVPSLDLAHLRRIASEVAPAVRVRSAAAR